MPSNVRISLDISKQKVKKVQKERDSAPNLTPGNNNIRKRSHFIEEDLNEADAATNNAVPQFSRGAELNHNLTEENNLEHTVHSKQASHVEGTQEDKEYQEENMIIEQRKWLN
mmetsp:Transcript_1464/g.2564  ORF Transcript_1464/g.2564 Transcript_1464/m.2564 type:complete len:113 (-) Transcript_1464:496-834(-)